MPGRRRTAHRYKYELRDAGRRASDAEGRPARLRGRAAAEERVGRLPLDPRVGRRRRGSSAAQAGGRAGRRRSRSTRCTSARGAAHVDGQPPARATSSSPTSSPTTSRDLGFTHVELLPVMEHPFAGSWGYQVTGYFAPTSRFGSPDDFRAFVDRLHQRGIGVILDWVPAHFPRDDWALARFDGTALYEHEDPRRGAHPDWGTLVFNYGRNEVRNFLLANALFWLREYHADGLRVDAVASMLYLDYSREEGAVGAERVRRQRGPRRGLVPASELNELVHGSEPGALSVAEESTAWPGVSRPTYLGGLGFGFKWNMGWMHDTLGLLRSATRSTAPTTTTSSRSRSCTRSPRTSSCRSRTTRSCTARARCCAKMPGDRWQQLANLRALYALHVGAPGQEAPLHGRRDRPGARVERTSARSTGTCSSRREHAGVQALVRDLNRVYRERAGAVGGRLRAERLPLAGAERRGARTCSRSPAGRRTAAGVVVCVCNLSPVPRDGYRVGMPRAGRWRRGAQHRLDALRRLGRRQPRRRRGRGASPGTTSRTRPR